MLPQAHQQPQQPPPPAEEATEGGKKPTTAGQGQGQGGNGDPLAPPASILSYPPLAQFTNLVLTSFNQLRCVSLFRGLGRWYLSPSRLYLPASHTNTRPPTLHCKRRQCTPWQLTGELEALFLLRMQAAVRAMLAHREVVDARHAAAYKLLCKVSHCVCVRRLHGRFVLLFGSALVSHSHCPTIMTTT